jgi:hypothetical protein
MKLQRPTIILSFAILMWFGLLILPRVAAAQVLSLQQLDIDESIVQADEAYSIPSSIVIVPIFRPSADFNVRDLDWYRGLYYFLIAGNNHSGFTDIPFHYVVASDGRIFKGNSGGEERKINIEGLGDKQVVIGYLAGQSDTTFDSRAEAAIGELAVTTAAKHGVKLDKIVISGMDYIRNDETQTVSLRKSTLFGTWSGSLKDIVDRYRYLYVPSTKDYKLEIVGGIKLPEDELEYGKTVTGTISIKNVGDYGIYGDTLSEVIATKVRGNSKFYFQSKWLSGSQFPLMDPSDSLRPGDQKDFSFSLKIPLIWGVYSENFGLRTIGGENVPNTRFDLTLNIKRPKGTIVQVKPTETGWLRVRSQPSGAAFEIARISTGNRYFQLQDQGNGWVQLDLGNGKKGWTSVQYLKYL